MDEEVICSNECEGCTNCEIEEENEETTKVKVYMVFQGTYQSCNGGKTEFTTRFSMREEDITESELDNIHEYADNLTDADGDGESNYCCFCDIITNMEGNVLYDNATFNAKKIFEERREKGLKYVDLTASQIETIGRILLIAMFTGHIKEEDVKVIQKQLDSATEFVR